MSEQNNPPKKDNKGYLFVNGNKNKPTQPDQTGRFVLDGKEFRISAWESTTTDGRPYLSLAITPYFPPNTNGGNNGGANSYQNNKPSGNSGQGYGNNNNNGNSGKNFTGAPISNDFDLDLDSILNNNDDDEPFN